MSDNNIIKALECCINGECQNCPLYKQFPYCDTDKDALALINRLQTEIELWKNEYKRACAERDAHIATTKFIRNEAIKEFAERLKADAMPAEIGKYTYRITTTQGIDYLVKEMVGERRKNDDK